MSYTALAALTCFSVRTGNAGSFGPDGLSVNPSCEAAVRTQDTVSQQGCLERLEATSTHVQVVVRADPPPIYRIVLFGCTAINACNVIAAVPTGTVTPPAGSPPRTMTRYSYSVANALLEDVVSLCARQDSSLPIGNVGGEDSALLGCLSKANNPAGTLAAATDKDGVVVTGWIIDPVSANPVPIEVRRGATSVSASANSLDPRSSERWPGFSASHGFRVTLPFIGRGGKYQVCLAAPGRIFTMGTDVAECVEHAESATLFIDKGKYVVGDTVRFSGEMLDPGARVRLNLLTSVGTFFLPWTQASIANLTADSRGHVDGQFSTRTIPPGTYRLAVQCESGCSNMPPYPFSLPGGGLLCCSDSHYDSNLPQSPSLSPVSLGPSLAVNTKSKASITVRITSGAGTRLEAKAANLPARSILQALIVVGGQRPCPNLPNCTPVQAFRRDFVDGLDTIRLPDVSVGSNGRAQLDVSSVDWVNGDYLLWLVSPPDTVVASTQFRIGP